MSSSSMLRTILSPAKITPGPELEVALIRAFDPPRTVSVRLAHENAPNESRVVSELALRPGFHPTPECHRRRTVRHEAGGMGYWF